MLPPERSARAGPEPPIAPLRSAAISDGAGALDDELRALGEEHHRLRDLLVLDFDELVERLR